MRTICINTVLISGMFIILVDLCAQQPSAGWQWPGGKKAAVSLTFDDARASQVTQGTPLLDKHGVKATFYVIPERMKPLLAEWEEAVSNGHEIGNHTINHPCTGNFQWTRDHPLEDYTLIAMRNELIEANHQIEEMLGVVPVSYAYTCGQKYVGRGEHTRSYIPVVAELFESGRGFLDETANARGYMDLAQLTGIESDGKDFEQIKPYLEDAKETGNWVVLAGHEMAEGGRQTTSLAMLEELIAYAKEPDNGIWLTTVEEVTEYILKQKEQQPLNKLKEALTFHASFDQGYDADFAKGNALIYTAPEYGKLELSEKGMNSPDIQLSSGNGVFGDALEL